MNVSVIIPAYRANETIEATLDSLLAQTHPGWEAVIIDDGSEDGTLETVNAYCLRDPRFRLLSQPHAGVSAARNRGIENALHEWLLFLDADDLITEAHLANLTQAAAQNPCLDAVCSGWARIGPDGRLLGDAFPALPDLSFAHFTRYCPYCIHACLVRRQLVQSVGGFEGDLRTCEDWDLWLRAARTGARFGAVKEVSALYRTKSGTASFNSRQMLNDGFQVLTQAHAPDARVRNPAPAYKDGQPASELPRLKYEFLCYCAGLALGTGDDPGEIAGVMHSSPCLDLNPQTAADKIFHAMRLSPVQSPCQWQQFWSAREKLASQFLDVLETQSQTEGFAGSAQVFLERLIAAQAVGPEPVTIGRTAAFQIDLSVPFEDLYLAEPVERVVCGMILCGQNLGTIELPACDGVVSRQVLADAAAAEFGWQILDQFFQGGLYREFETTREEGGRVVWRRGVRLAGPLPEDAPALTPYVHQQAGWLLFLQEVWARPDWPLDRFYDPSALEEVAPVQEADSDWMQIEVSQTLPHIITIHPHLNILLTVGGAAVGVVTVPVEGNFLQAQKIRAEATRAGGFELCRAAVRAGLIGRPISDPASLSQRLSEAAAAARAMKTQPITSENDFILLAPETSAVLAEPLTAGGRSLLLARRMSDPIDSSASRRSMLPREAARDLRQAWELRGEPVIGLGQPSDEPRHIFYTPDLCWQSMNPNTGAAEEIQAPLQSESRTWRYDRTHFEALFARSSDPWGYTSDYEQVKYQQTLGLLPKQRIPRALEIGCAEGHFTRELARKVDHLIAADVSQIALERASARCAGLGNIQYLLYDLTKDRLPGPFDLIVCSEVLYYVGDLDALREVCASLAEAVRPGGYLLLAHAHMVVDEPDRTGFDWGLPFGAKRISDILHSISSLDLRKELHTPLYRIQLYQRKIQSRLSFHRPKAEITRLEQPPAMPQPEAAATICWEREPQAARQVLSSEAVTSSLPILMYHRIADEGSEALARYRVPIRAFEEQIRYLRSAGYYSIRMAEWQAAMARHEPLPGRAVMITFDDGYQDFLSHAWPILKDNGFSATVYLVAGQAGCPKGWDLAANEAVPLLSWDEVRWLQSEGVMFGSHTLTHRRMTGLAPVEIVREAVGSRTILERELKMQVKAIAYPYGAVDRVVQHLAGACGYLYGLTCEPRRSGLWDQPLALPRIEVSGHDRFTDFVLKLDAGAG